MKITRVKKNKYSQKYQKYLKSLVKDKLKK